LPPPVATRVCLMMTCRTPPLRDTGLVATGASGCAIPAPPGADSLPHDECLIRLGQPRHLLGEHRHALPPGARHLRDVGTPEQPLWTEGVVELTHERLHRRKRVRLARVAGRTGRLDGDI